MEQYDFDLCHPDGSVSAVEVTSSVDQAIEQTYARIRDPRKGGAMVKTKLCKKDWLVHPGLGADPKLIRLRIDRYLAAIECQGIDEFWAPTDLHRPSVERVYHDLGIVSGSVFPHWKERGQIGICLSPSTSAGPSKRRLPQLRLAESGEALKGDNRRKLGAGWHA